MGINNFVTGLQLTFADESTYDIGTFPISPTVFEVAHLLGWTGTMDGDNVLQMMPITFDEACYAAAEAIAPAE